MVIAAGRGGDDDFAFVAGRQVDGVKSDAGSYQGSDARHGGDDFCRPRFGSGDNSVEVFDGTDEY